MSSQQIPSLPSVLPSIPALQDIDTTPEQIKTTVGRSTNPEETKIVICALNKCHRLFPSRERLLIHRRKEHGTDDVTNEWITWND